MRLSGTLRLGETRDLGAFVCGGICQCDRFCRKRRGSCSAAATTDVKSKLLHTTALKGQKGNAVFLFLLLISAGGWGGAKSWL